MAFLRKKNKIFRNWGKRIKFEVESGYNGVISFRRFFTNKNNSPFLGYPNFKKTVKSSHCDIEIAKEANFSITEVNAKLEGGKIWWLSGVLLICNLSSLNRYRLCPESINPQ